jgi:HEAT repeat protein
MKRYLAVFMLGLALLIIVSVFALFSRPLVCRIYQLCYFELPDGGMVWAHRSEIDRLPHPPDPTTLPGVWLQPRALILLALGDWARDYFLFFSLPGLLLVYFGLRALKRELDGIGDGSAAAVIPGRPAPSLRSKWLIRFGVSRMLIYVGCAAVLFWTLRVLWPMWQDHRALRMFTQAMMDRDSDDPDRFREALDGFEWLERNPGAVRVLADKLNDADPDVRYVSVLLLGRIGARAQLAKPAVRSLMEDEEPLIRIRAAVAYWKITAQSDLSVAVLTEILNTDAEWRHRHDAAQALGGMGAAAEAAVPALGTALADDNAEVRCESAESLGEIGPAAIAAIPDLQRALEAEHPRLCLNVAQALWKIDRRVSEALHVLTDLLKGDDQTTAYLAARQLGEMGAAARAAVPNLLNALQSHDSDVRDAALDAIRQVDPALATSIR